VAEPVQAHSEVYCYGMVAPSALLLLEGPYPSANGYAEIGRTLFNLAGEAVAGAWVLSRLGRRCRLAGRWLADRPESDELIRFLVEGGIDCAKLERMPGYHPVEEIVISDGKTRTVFGGYRKILFTERQWSPPVEADIANSRLVLLDPFLGKDSELAAELCARHGIPHASIDVGPASRIAKTAAALVVSEEFLLREFPDRGSWERVFSAYAEACPGLVTFTFGADPLWYALPGSGKRERRLMKPFAVEARDSTGAGDSFRAGLAYGMLTGRAWPECLRIACAVSGMVCERFPGVLESPTVEELDAFLASSGE
jgi:sugar/nucleoside kinase (ribokinase family)